MTDTRDVTMSVKGVQLVVTVLIADPRQPKQKPRRWAVRVTGSKEDVSEILASHVLEAIDKKLAGSPLPVDVFEADIPFGNPTLVDIGPADEPSDEERLGAQEAWTGSAK